MPNWTAIRKGFTRPTPILAIAILRSKASRSTLLSRRRPPFLSPLSGPVSLDCLLTACGGSPTHPTPPASSGGPPASTVQAAVSQAYQREFGLSIPSPAIFNDPRSQNCAGAGHLTTTAYLRTGSRTALLHFLYMSRDAGAVIRRDPPSSVVAPAGTFRALVVVTQHPETVGFDSLMLLEAAQRQINEDHAAFARAKGFPSPIVSFESTNVVISPTQIVNPRSRDAVLAAAGREGLGSSGYDFVVSLNIDPTRSEGGFATPGDVSSTWGITRSGERLWAAMTGCASPRPPTITRWHITGAGRLRTTGPRHAVGPTWGSGRSSPPLFSSDGKMWTATGFQKSSTRRRTAARGRRAVES
jgi:hypothetical protein